MRCPCRALQPDPREQLGAPHAELRACGIGCIAGALDEQVYRDKLAATGFMAIEVEPTRIYRIEDAKDFLAASGLDASTLGLKVDGKFMSAFVRARKPNRV
jgi:arsenite methyltransferase